MATPTGIAVAAAASHFGLRPTRLAATKDLHHLRGHQLSDKEFPRRANTIHTMQRYLSHAWASQGARDALKQAWSEFTTKQ